LNAQIEGLMERLSAKRRMLDILRLGRNPVPAGSSSSAPTPSGPATKSQDAGERNRPHYIYFYSTSNRDGRGPAPRILVASPDGAQVASYNAESGKSTPLKLPAINGVRREILPASSLARPDVPATMPINDGSWFMALDLDRADKVTRIAAFNIDDDGTWVAHEVPEPVDRSSLKRLPNWVFALGRHVLAISPKANRWGVLELPPGVEPKPFWVQSTTMIEKEGRLYRFNYETGTWDDIYARAIEDKPAETAK
jgi:hypothetical protein